MQQVGEYPIKLRQGTHAPHSPHRPPRVSTAYPEQPELGCSGLSWDPRPSSWMVSSLPASQKGRPRLWSRTGRRVSCLPGSSISQVAFPGQHPGLRVSAAEVRIMGFPVSPACPEVTLLWQEAGSTGSRPHVSTTLPPCGPASGEGTPPPRKPSASLSLPISRPAWGLGHICAHPQGPRHRPFPPLHARPVRQASGLLSALPTLRTAGLRPACPLSTHRGRRRPSGAEG